MPHLAPPGDARQRLAAAYYTCLDAHPPFARDLLSRYQALAEALDGLAKLGIRPLTATPPLGDGTACPPTHALALAVARRAKAACRLEAGYAEVCLERAQMWRQAPEPLTLMAEQAAQAWLALGRTHLAGPQGVLTWLDERRRALAEVARQACRAALSGALRRWPLPQGAPDDLITSFVLWRAVGRPDRPIVLPAPLVATAPLPSPFVAPPPPPFRWNPAHEGRPALHDRFDAWTSELKRQLLAWAEALEVQVKAAGWQEPPRRTPDVSLRAQRLFLRAVCRQSWRQIAIATGGTDLHLVRRQVLADAATLGLSLHSLHSLSARRTPGRDR